MTQPAPKSAALAPRALRPQEAAAYLGISRSKLYELLADQSIPVITIYDGGPKKVLRDDLDAYLDGRKRVAQDALTTHLAIVQPRSQR